MNREEVKMSFAAAEVFPAKLLHHKKLIESCTEKGFIPPIHLQLNPTNKCNFDCSFCSCKNRDKSLELSHDEVMTVMRTAKSLGTEAVTITGGGEPLLHPKISELVNGIDSLGIKIGLVTNGSLFHKIKPESLEKVVWCRVSCSDELALQLKRIGKNTSEWLDGIEEAVASAPRIDWAFSYLVSKPRPDLDLIEEIVSFANHYGFTHVRLVNDILKARELEKASAMERIEADLKIRGIDDSKVNYQSRSEWVVGDTECYIALAKPVLAADGHWLACCGIQYAFSNPAGDYEKRGWITDKRLSEGLRDLVENQRVFNGSACAKCYYSRYNQAFKILLSDMKHLEFV